MQAEEQVILVDKHDQEIGLCEKMEAHFKGLLHRAFSVFIFNKQGELLLQQRATHKYHSGGLWTNTCCSHPRPDESTLAAANRRLLEEMGMNTKLEFAFSFLYRAELDQGLIEHELDHVFIGISDTVPQLNPEEAGAYRYVSIQQLRNDISLHPEKYTAWFKLCLDRVIAHKGL